MATAEQEQDIGNNLEQDEKAVIVEGAAAPSSLWRSPMTQVVMLGVLCFLCPGLFNALSGMGGGGQMDPTTADNGSVALYSTFAVFSFFAGSVVNVLGARLTLFLGSLGYCLYVSSLLAYNMHGSKAQPFVIVAGAILGVCASLLWSAQGSLMLAYPTEATKGRYIATFWAIFNLGAVVGASILLGQNYHNPDNTVNNATYAVFVALTGLGALLPFMFVNPSEMVRVDGTRVIVPKHPSWKTELVGLYEALRKDAFIIVMFPFFFASNIFYTWHFNDFASPLFSLRARALSSLLYWLSQIIGSWCMGAFLDSPSMTRRQRAFAGWGIIFILINVLWGASLKVQLRYTRDDVAGASWSRLDFGGPHQSLLAGYLILQVCNGLQDAAWQTFAYCLGSLSNSPRKLAYMTGFYKAFQSAGAAVFWRLDANKVPYIDILGSTWGILGGSLICALPMLWFRVKNITAVDVVEVHDDDITGAKQPTPPTGAIETQSTEKVAEKV